jgi:hypothetical protein
MNNYSQSANPNATNSELDSKKIVTNRPLTSNMETINVFEVLPREDSKTIANLIWKLLDKAGIETTKDAELQIEVYDDEED